MCASLSFADGRNPLKAKRVIQKSEYKYDLLNVASVKFLPVFNSFGTMYRAGDNSFPVWEDFSKFTAGSEAQPDATEVSDQQTGVIDASYTLQPGWAGAAIYQAGGTAYIGMWGDETGFINTPEVDLTANGGTFTVSFRAKSALPGGDELAVLHLYPDEMYAKNSAQFELTTEWQEFKASLSLGSEYSFIQMWTNNGEWFIDDVKIESSGVSAPVNLAVKNYKGTSATLCWDAVDGADSYLLNVYYFDASTYDYAYLLENESVKGTSYDVTGLDENLMYFFDVRAVVGEEVSPLSESATIESSVAAPEALPATDYAGTSFTANWTEVSGAAGYLLSVYYETISEDGYETLTNYVLENEEVQGTSYTVDGLDESLVYYYTVKAVMDDGTYSKPSAAVAALPELDKPEVAPATEVTSSGFVANWKAVDFAQIYIPYLYKQHTAQADELYTFAETDFSSIVSTGTLEAPETTFDVYVFDGATGAYGWYISMAAFMEGGVGLDNSFASWFGPSFMYSPELDLSKSGGKVSVTLSFASVDATSLVVTLATLDEDNYFVEINPVTLDVTSEMTEHTVELDGGTESCYILVYATDGTSLMFDALKTAINLKKGDSFENVIDSKILENGETSIKFDGLAAVPGEKYAYNVVAVFYGDQYNIVYSEISDKVYVDLNNSVAEAEADASARVYVTGDVLNVYNPDCEAVAVYDAAGCKVFAADNCEENMEVSLANRGIYLVKVGDKVMKVVR